MKQGRYQPADRRRSSAKCGEVNQIAKTDTSDEKVVPKAEAHAHWSIFLPTGIVAILYAGAWGILKLAGYGDGDLGRLVFIVIVVAPPLLVVQAFLRYYSIGLALTGHHVLLVKGWPRTSGRQVGLGDVAIVDVTSGILGKWLGVGSVHLLLRNGQRVGVSDLAEPERIAEKIRQNLPGSILQSRD